MGAIVDFLKPILFSLLNNNKVKKLVVELLEKYSKETDNSIDDVVVAMVREKLLG